ncbi:MAG: DUF3788 domain-containing protein [Dehalococcoidia bacterium]|nr:DUF3788 domain-containing protein [Dehalococcoidia bacterium]
MPAPGDRMLDNNAQPTRADLEEWLGPEAWVRWTALQAWIKEHYRDVFAPDWLYGGKKHGWGLRYKRTKAFCTLVPEVGQVRVVIVLGTAERERVESFLAELSAPVRAAYEAAETFNDGKWAGIVLDSDAAVADVERILASKRRVVPPAR